MAYTYDNILEEARKAGVLDKFSQEDLNAAQKNPEYGMSLVGLLKDVNNATTETQRLLATEAMNNLRKSYGVTGSVSGTTGSSFSEAQRLVAPEKTGTLSGSDATTYQTVLDDIVNQKEFTYDHEQDPVYQSYKKTYMREGDRASANALAQAAAMTGGRPSSYAISAAQQAGNYYAAQLADMIPTLRQNALTEYQNDMAAKYDILSVLSAQKEAQEAAQAQAYKNLIEMASSGYVPTAAELTEAGMTQEQADALNAAYAASLKGTLKSTEGIWDNVAAEIDKADSPEALQYILDKYEGWGYDTTQIEKSREFQEKAVGLLYPDSDQGNQPVAGGNTANTPAVSGNMLSQTQWAAKRKKFEKGQREGDGMYSWEGQFSTYDAYLKAWAEKYGRL